MPSGRMLVVLVLALALASAGAAQAKRGGERGPGKRGDAEDLRLVPVDLFHRDEGREPTAAREDAVAGPEPRGGATSGLPSASGPPRAPAAAVGFEELRGRLPEAEGAAGLAGVPTTVAMAGTGLIGVVLLGLALVLARRAGRPRTSLVPPPEAARRAALARQPSTPAEALDAIAKARLGKVVAAEAGETAALVRLARKRGVPCAVVAAWLGGAFESAWGRDVDVRHECGGRRRKAPCAFEVRPRRPG